MKIYLLSYMESQEGNCLSYHSCRTKAEQYMLRIKKEGEYPERINSHRIAEFDIPSSKTGVLNFLNRHTPSQITGKESE
jgi:hypothetical protein